MYLWRWDYVCFNLRHHSIECALTTGACWWRPLSLPLLVADAAPCAPIRRDCHRAVAGKASGSSARQTRHPTHFRSNRGRSPAHIRLDARPGSLLADGAGATHGAGAAGGNLWRTGAGGGSLLPHCRLPARSGGGRGRARRTDASGAHLVHRRRQCLPDHTPRTG